MIMPIATIRQERFDWTETPREIYRDEIGFQVAMGVRRCEREMTAFLREWCGTDCIEPNLGAI